MNSGFQIYTWKTILFLKLFGEHVEKQLSYKFPWSEIEKQRSNCLKVKRLNTPPFFPKSSRQIGKERNAPIIMCHSQCPAVDLLAVRTIRRKCVKLQQGNPDDPIYFRNNFLFFTHEVGSSKWPSVL